MVKRPGSPSAEETSVGATSTTALRGQSGAATRLARDTSHVLELVRQKTGSDFSQYKSKMLERRIRRRMAVHRVTSMTDYARILESDRTEADRLRREMLISVTRFFRDREAFDALGAALDQLVAEKSPGASLRIWVPGCATGEEAYSIAILVAEVQRARGKHLVVQIFATDIDADAVRTARSGVYARESLAGLDDALVNRYFHTAGEGLRAVKSLREQILFACQNLLSDPPFSRLDLVSCRNLLIYFDGELQSRVIPLVHYALAPSGLLFLGKSETIGKNTDLFQPVGKSTKWKIYRRQETPTPPRLVLPRPSPHAIASGVPQTLPRGEVRLEALTDHEIVTALDTRAVVVDEDLDIVFIRGDLKDLQGSTDGLRGFQVLEFMREELRPALRSLLRRVQRKRLAVDSGPVRLEDPEGARCVRMIGRPLDSGSQALTLVVFRVETIREGLPRGADEHYETRIAALELSLEAAREDLQSTIAELKSSNEERRHLNEELQTAKEELEASNEELQATTTEVRRREVELRALAEHAPDVVMRFDRQARHIDVSPRVASYTDVSPESFIGKSHRELGFPASLCDRIERGVGLVYQGGNAATFELELERPGGETRYLRARVVPELDSDGSVDTVLALVRDITRRKRYEDQLREQEERWRAFFSQRVVAMAIASPQREIVEVNERLCELLGYERQELIGMSWAALTHPEDLDKGDAYQGRLFRGELDGFSLEARVVRKDGEVLPFLISVTGVRDAAGRLLYTVAMGLDRTEQRRVEAQFARLEDELRQAQKMEAVGTLAGGVAHEFNNVLATITGLADLMLADPRLASVFEPELEEIIRASERGKDLVQQILTFSRKSTRRLRRVDLNEEVRHASTLLGHTLPKMIRIRLELEPELPAILGDPNQMEQILLSLATNARDAMKDGGELLFATRLTVVEPGSRDRRHVDLAPGRYVELQVSDTGQGVSESVLPRIFEPFFTTKPVGAGTGLGLSTVYGIVRSHNGAISCESEEARGATFYVLLPVDDSGLAGVLVEPSLDALLPSITGGHEKIMVIDDEPVLLRSLELHLERKGYKVRTASTGEEALQNFVRLTQPVDLIVLDINMPGMGGLKALERIKRMRPELRVIVASGHAPDASQQQFPVDLWLQKPFRIDVLLRAVRAVLDGKQEPLGMLRKARSRS